MEQEFRGKNIDTSPQPSPRGEEKSHAAPDIDNHPIPTFPVQGRSPHIAIIGAGAAGCVCAYFLLKKGIDVILFDKGMPLRTLLPTGGGRCNLAHAEYDFKELARNYPRGNKFLMSAFSRFSTWDTLALFEELGIKTYTQEDGRIFPLSNSAKKVRETILKTIEKAKVIKGNIIDIEKIGENFIIKTSPHPDPPPRRGNKFTHIIIATGGHSGYQLLESLDIKIVEPKPSLVGLSTQECFKDISGTVCKEIKYSGMVGDILFTHFGVSGPLIYKISSIKAFDKFPYELEFDLAPELDNLQEILNNNPHKDIKNILKEFLPLKVVDKILIGLTPPTPSPSKEGAFKAHMVNKKTRELILTRIHKFKITVTGTNRGEETVTAGGVDLDEINPKTMEVKKVPGLYCIGEVLNIDGFCGGFNLQNAWTTAFVAAESIKK